MGQYESKDVVFDYPDGWVDRTVVAFSPPPSPRKPSAANFVMTREKLGKDESLKTFSARQLMQMAKGLRDFELKDNRDVVIGGGNGVQLDFTWMSPNAALSQRVTMVQHGIGVLIFTATAPVAEANATREVFDRMLASIQLRALPVPSIAPIPTTASDPPPDPPKDRPPQGWGPGSGRR